MLSWISIITLSLWIDDCLKLFLFRLEDYSSFLVIFSDCIKWKESLFYGVSTIDCPPWKLVWFHFGVRKLPFSLWNSLFLFDGLLDEDWQYEFLTFPNVPLIFETDSFHFNPGAWAVVGTLNILDVEGSKLSWLLFHYLNSDFGSSIGMFDFS